MKSGVIWTGAGLLFAALAGWVGYRSAAAGDYANAAALTVPAVPAGYCSRWDADIYRLMEASLDCQRYTERVTSRLDEVLATACICPGPHSDSVMP